MTEFFFICIIDNKIVCKRRHKNTRFSAKNFIFFLLFFLSNCLYFPHDRKFGRVNSAVKRFVSHLLQLSSNTESTTAVFESTTRVADSVTDFCATCSTTTTDPAIVTTTTRTTTTGNSDSSTIPSEWTTEMLAEVIRLDGNEATEREEPENGTVASENKGDGAAKKTSATEGATADENFTKVPMTGGREGIIIRTFRARARAKLTDADEYLFRS